MMNNGFNFRFANKDDAGILLGFIKELAEYEHMESDCIADEKTLCERLFENKKAEVLLAYEDTTPIGYALFFHSFSTFIGKDGIYLEDLYITPCARKKGHGKKLFTEVAKIAEARGCARLEWSCLDWNTSSIEFYLSLGAVAMDGWTMYRLTEDKIKSLCKNS